MQPKLAPLTECPCALAVETVGEWWSILILRDALQGLTRFDEFERSLGIAPNMLTRRLTALVDAGMLERKAYSERPPRYEYVPTAKGEDFRMVLMSLVAWGNRHYAEEGASVQVVERGTGRLVQPMMADADGQVVPLDACTLQAGPAASAGMRERLESFGQ